MEANGRRAAGWRSFSCGFRPASMGRSRFRDRVNDPLSPAPDSPLSYPAVNRYSSSSLSSQASAEVSNITGQSESSDEVFNMQVPVPFPSGLLMPFCLRPEPFRSPGCVGGQSPRGRTGPKGRLESLLLVSRVTGILQNGPARLKAGAGDGTAQARGVSSEPPLICRIVVTT